MAIQIKVNSTTFPDTYYPNGEVNLIVSKFSDNVKYGVSALPVGGAESTSNYDSGAFVMSMGGRTIKYTVVIEVVIKSSSVTQWQVYQNFRKLFGDYSIGSYINITCDELGWTDKQLVVDSHSARIEGGTKNYMTITLTLLAGELG